MAMAIALGGTIMARQDGTAPAAKPAGTTAHPYQAPAGREAATHTPSAARPIHHGPTPVKTATRSEATHRKAVPARPVHNGPTQPRTQRDKATMTHISK